MSKRCFAGWLVAGTLTLLATMAVGAEPERRWEIHLGDFFRGGTKPVYLYGREREGQWIGVVGSSRGRTR